VIVVHVRGGADAVDARVDRGGSVAARDATAITADSLLLAFGFSAGVGLLFGLWPARRAATLNPIETLRHK
jgi:hypothetical protein